MFSLLRALLEDFNFEEIQRREQVYGPFIFALFVSFVYFVALNILIVIILDAYDAASDYVKADKRSWALFREVEKEVQRHLPHNAATRLVTQSYPVRWIQRYLKKSNEQAKADRKRRLSSFQELSDNKPKEDGMKMD